MCLEKGRIGSHQLIFLMVGFTIGASQLLPPGGQAGHDAWIAILIGLVEALLLALIYSILASRFPGKTFVQISDTVYGPYLGKLVSVFFIWFLFHVASLVISNFTDFFGVFMPQTPSPVFAILLGLVCALVVRGGVEVMARCSQVFVPLTVLVSIISSLLLINEIDLGNLQPIFEASPGKLLWAAHSAAMFPLADTVAFLMVIPFVNNIKAVIPSVVKALVIAAVILTLDAIRNIGTLGIITEIAAYPSITAVRIINIANAFERLEIFVVISLITMAFIRISVFFYGTVLGTAQMLGLTSYRVLVYPVGILIIILSLTNFRTFTENVELINLTWPIYTIPFVLGLPLITLLLAIIRKLPREVS